MGNNDYPEVVKGRIYLISAGVRKNVIYRTNGLNQGYVQFFKEDGSMGVADTGAFVLLTDEELEDYRSQTETAR